jgi:hypothetical protein
MMATSVSRAESVGMNGLYHAYFRDMILSKNNQPQQSQLCRRCAKAQSQKNDLHSQIRQKI